MTLAQDTQILLLDESTTFLDLTRRIIIEERSPTPITRPKISGASFLKPGSTPQQKKTATAAQNGTDLTFGVEVRSFKLIFSLFSQI